MTHAIEVQGLVKQYTDTRAVDGIDFHVAQGELVALLGPNGAGKTTTVEILEGYRTATAGSVSVLGHDPATAGRDWKARIGIVLQEAADNADLKVIEAVQHYSKYYPNPRPVNEVIDAVGLSEKANSRVDQLSGGQRRRLDVALGILGRPEMLFLDEPTTGFDPEARREFWDLIESLHHQGTTILLTTHYMEEAERLADRVVIIASGRIVANDTPAMLGGRQRMEATVSWIENGEHKSEPSATPTQFVLDLSQRLGGEVDGLVVSRPTLEDIYMQLVEGGRS